MSKNQLLYQKRSKKQFIFLANCYYINRPWAYLGFAIGTVYQYLLLKIMVSIVFADIEGVPEYNFDVPAMLVTLILFVVLYEMVMFVYTKRMEKLSVKEIMLE